MGSHEEPFYSCVGFFRAIATEEAEKGRERTSRVCGILEIDDQQACMQPEESSGTRLRGVGGYHQLYATSRIDDHTGVDWTLVKHGSFDGTGTEGCYYNTVPFK